jgi:hypothetical protein
MRMSSIWTIIWNDFHSFKGKTFCLLLPLFFRKKYWTLIKMAGNNWEYEKVTKYIIYQQFFEEPNYIRDRQDKTKIAIPGSDKVIHALLDIFEAKSDLWSKGETQNYIEYLADKLDIDSFLIRKRYQTRLSSLIDEQKQDDNFTMMLLVSDVIGILQEEATKSVTQILQEELQGELSHDEIKESLDQLSTQGYLDFSLLLNLGILLKYAEITDVEISTELFFNKLESVKNKITN